MRPVFGLLPLLALVLALPFGACDAFEQNWLANVDSAALYSLSRPEYMGRASAYDLANPLGRGGGAVVVERADDPNLFRFDFAVSEVDGQLVALPAGMFDTFDILPGIAAGPTGVSFEDWDLAPRDDYVTDAPVPLREGALYAVRTRRDSFNRCTHYGKIEILSIDADGVVELRAVRNSLCNDRELIPPDED